MKLTVILVSALVLVCLLLAAEARGNSNSRGNENRSNGRRSQSRSGGGRRSRSRSASTSEEVCCGVPPCGDFTIRREEVNETSFMALDTITYTCATGHGIQESEASSGDILCQANCTWTNLPICEPVECDAPEVGVNTEPFEARPLTFSQTFNYQCLEGHLTTNNRLVICTSDGSLSSPAPSCTPIFCGTPPEGMNTVAVDSGPISSPDTFTYECSAGFETSDGLTISCLASGMFSGPAPECTRVPCTCIDFAGNRLDIVSGSDCGTFAVFQRGITRDCPTDSMFDLNACNCMGPVGCPSECQ